MSFGKRLSEVRKDRGLSQGELAQLIGTKGPAIGRYERESAKPTIEVAARIAGALDISLDYLIGKIDADIDQSIVDKVRTIQALPEEEKNRILFTLDALLRDAKSRFAYSR